MTEEELFLTAILNCSRSDLYTHPRRLTNEQQTTLDTMCRRRQAGEPVQYITGFTDFFGYRMEVGPGVLVPRPETEVLADVFIREMKKRGRKQHVILDVATGSGCLAVTLVKELSDCRVLALDVSPQALSYARRNAELNGVADRITFVERDVFWFMDEVQERFDGVISNPPYVPSHAMDDLPADVRHEPPLALDGGPDGLHFYRLIVPKAGALLVPGGLIGLEFGDGQQKEMQNLFAITGPWDKIETSRDHAGKWRVILGQRPN